MYAIVQVIDGWSEAKDRQDEVTVIFFDFSKAFDLVDHCVFLEKLHGLLLPWLPYWIDEYLSDRVQRIRVGEITIKWNKEEVGVVQVSVLGSILFILFIHEINKYLPLECVLIKYFDNILAYILGRYFSNLHQKIAN